MKTRICLLFAIAAVLFAASLSPAAAETCELIPRKAFWRGSSHGGAYVMVEEDLDSFLFYSSRTEGSPSVQTLYEAPLILATEGNSLVYHIKVTRGACRIEFLAEGEKGETVALSLGDALGVGSDQPTGIYKGALPLEDLKKEESVTLLGIRVYTVDGGKAEILALGVMRSEDVPPDVSEAESSEGSSLPEETEESSKEEEESVAPVSRDESFDEERSRDAVFVSREDVEFTPVENAITVILMTAVSLLAVFLAALIGISLFRRSRPDL